MGPPPPAHPPEPRRLSGKLFLFGKWAKIPKLRAPEIHSRDTSSINMSSRAEILKFFYTALPFSIRRLPEPGAKSNARGKKQCPGLPGRSRLPPELVLLLPLPPPAVVPVSLPPRLSILPTHR